jgi:hypothetical protein
MLISDKNINMETTIHLDDQLFDRAQQFALAAGQTVDAFIAQTIKESLEKQSTPSGTKTHLIQNSEMQLKSPEEKFCFPRETGSRLRPGVDISNSAELLDIMEEGLDISKRR